MCNSSGISGVRFAKSIGAAFGIYKAFQSQNRVGFCPDAALLICLHHALGKNYLVLRHCTGSKRMFYSRTMKKYLVFSLVAGGLLLTACGKKEESSAATSSSAPAPTAAAPAAPAVTTIELTANDTMKFNVTRFEVAAGKDVKLVLTNLGTMPKVAMGHNVVILKKDADVKAYADAAVAASATEYIPAGKADQVVAHTKLLGPKQSDEITFKAPTEPGEYPFICSFPAHFLSGMKGVMVVK
jgi:azurin